MVESGYGEAIPPHNHAIPSQCHPADWKHLGLFTMFGVEVWKGLRWNKFTETPLPKEHAFSMAGQTITS